MTAWRWCSLVLLAGLLGCAAEAPARRRSARPRRARPRPAAVVSDAGALATVTPDASSAPEPGGAPSVAAEMLRMGGPARPAGGASGAVVAPPAGSFGSPVVEPPDRRSHELRPRVLRAQRRLRVVCDGVAVPQVISPQCPFEPTTAATVRAFLAVERELFRCRPPTDDSGRLAVRGLFRSGGMPEEFSFPSVRLTDDQALCVGRALCDVRVPAFRTPNATVNYGFVVYVPAQD